VERCKEGDLPRTHLAQRKGKEREAREGRWMLSLSFEGHKIGLIRGQVQRAGRVVVTKGGSSLRIFSNPWSQKGNQLSEIPLVAEFSSVYNASS